jgi:hypothetical protein
MRFDLAFYDPDMPDTVILVGGQDKQKNMRYPCSHVSLECYELVKAEMTPDVRAKIKELQNTLDLDGNSVYWETNQHDVMVERLRKKYPQFKMSELSNAYYIFEHWLDQ